MIKRNAARFDNRIERNTYLLPNKDNLLHLVSVMAITHTFHADFSLVVTRFAGDIDDKQILDAAETLRNDPQVRPDYNELVDLRDVHKLNTTPSAIERVAEEFSDYSKSGGARRLQALLVGTKFQYGMSRMYEAYSTLDGGQRVHVFTEPNEALDWLGVKGLAPEDIHGANRRQTGLEHRKEA